MNVVFIIAGIFSEFLVVILGLAAFAVLCRQFLRRRQASTLAFAAYFLLLALGFGLLFLGQVFEAYGASMPASWFVHAPHYALALQPLFILPALVALYVKKGRGPAFAIAIIIALVSLAAALRAVKGLAVVEGLTMTELSSTAFLMSFGGWTAMTLALVLLPWKNGRATVADRYFREAGIAGALFIISVAAAIMLRLEALMLVTLVLLAIQSAFLFLGALAKGNPDPLLAERPSAIVSGRLLAKAVVFNAVLFWFLAFALLAITSHYFVSAAVEDRKATMRRDLQYLTRSYAAYSMSLLDETQQLASDPSLAEVTAGSTAAPPRQIEEYLALHGEKRIIRIVDAGGVIRYSSLSPEEVGRSFADSAVVRMALQGKKVAATEKEPLIDLWMIRAAAPIVPGDGTAGGVLVSTDIAPVFDLSNFSGFAPPRATSIGFISEGGEQVYASGMPLDGVTKSSFRKLLGNSSYFGGETGAEDLLFMERIYATNGVPNGFIYVFLTNAMLQEQLFRILSLVTLMVLLSVTAMMAVLIFSTSLLLRPIGQLRRAAREIEKENYDLRVDYDAPDELGMLATAFNRMSGAIGERTKKLRIAVQEERDFLTYTAHEMRNPLNIFRWSLELLRFGDTGKLNREQLELLEQMHQTNQRLFAMVQNLLDAAKIEEGRLTLEKGPVAIEDVIETSAGMLSVKMRQKNINFHWKRPPKPLPKVRGDRERLRQIVMNIMSNAVKYTGNDGHIEVSAEVTDEQGPGGKPGTFIRVAVEDNGKGIPEDQHHRVYNRFFRGRNVVAGEIEGVGLGLHITKKLVGLHGGRTWFNSKEGVGSTFYFTVPVEK